MFRFGFEDRDRRRKEKEYEEEKFPSELDAEEYGFKYLSWVVKINWELLKEPAKLEDWDFYKYSAFQRFSAGVHTLVGHYEIDTKPDIGVTEGYTHFDYIHFPEVELVLQLALNPDKGSDNNYGIVERTITIPEQTLKFDNLKAGDWREGEVNPYSIDLKVDIDKKKYTFDKEDLTGFSFGLWNGWDDLEGDRYRD
jgi:hypothetical protein